MLLSSPLSSPLFKGLLHAQTLSSITLTLVIIILCLCVCLPVSSFTIDFHSPFPGPNDTET